MMRHGISLPTLDYKVDSISLMYDSGNCSNEIPNGVVDSEPERPAAMRLKAMLLSLFRKTSNSPSTEP